MAINAPAERKIHKFFLFYLEERMIQWNNDSMKQWLAYSQGQHRDWACVRKIGLNNIKQTPLHPQLQPQLK